MTKKSIKKVAYPKEPVYSVEELLVAYKIGRLSLSETVFMLKAEGHTKSHDQKD